MSELRTVTQQCPHCSKKSELEIYSSINVSLDPSLKKKILDSSLFDWECPHCHETFNLLYGFLYHDMKDDYMIFFEPDEIPCTELVKDSEMPEMPAMFNMDGYKFRQVHGLNRLKEKIHIIDAQLNDIAIELLKLYLKIHNEEIQAFDVYFESLEDGKFTFAFYNPEAKKWGSFSLPADAYTENLKLIEQNEEFMPAKNMCVEVNERWVHERIRLYMENHTPKK